MFSSIGFKEKSKKLETKFLELRNGLQSTYDLIKTDSGFHSLNTFTKSPARIESFFDLIGNSFSPDCIKPRIKITIKLPSLISKKVILNGYYEVFDWAKGRISGPVVKLTIRKGVIVEKVLLSPNGRLITINSLQLKLMQRLSL